jgi:hypothetical protein
MSQVPRHQCLIYSGAPSAFLPAFAATIRDKLKDNFRCLYLNSPPMVAGIGSYLAAAGVDVARELAKDSLVLSSDIAHLISGRFDIDRMMETLEDALTQAMADGYRGLWASGDMSWEFGPERDLAKLLEYEWRLEELFQKYPTMTGVCQYHADLLPPEFVRQAVLSHPAVYINETLARFNPHFRQTRTYGVAAVEPELDQVVSALYAPER